MTGMVECTTKDGKVWINLRNVMRMQRDRTNGATVVKFIDGSALCASEEPNVLVEKAGVWANWPGNVGRAGG
jgi:hypothetical protein